MILRALLTLIAILLANPATANFLLLLSPQQSVAVPAPTLSLNFISNTGFNGASTGTAASFMTITRGGTGATDLLPTSPAGASYQTITTNTLRITPNLGLLVEGSRVNSALNSVNPSGSNVATSSLANATYVFWMNGTGSVTMSAGTATGCSTATVINGSFATFTTTGTAGTCLLTFSGTVNAVQVEAGAFPSSFVITTGSAVTRGNEIITVTSPTAIGAAGAVSYAVAVTMLAPLSTTAQNTLQIDDSTNTNRTTMLRLVTSGQSALVNSGGVGSQVTGTVLQTGVLGRIAASNATNFEASTQDAANPVVNTAVTYTVPAMTVYRLGNSATTSLNACYCYIASVKVWPATALTPAQLVQITKAGSS